MWPSSPPTRPTTLLSPTAFLLPALRSRDSPPMRLLLRHHLLLSPVPCYTLLHYWSLPWPSSPPTRPTTLPPPPASLLPTSRSHNSPPMRLLLRHHLLRGPIPRYTLLHHWSLQWPSSPPTRPMTLLPPPTSLLPASRSHDSPPMRLLLCRHLLLGPVPCYTLLHHWSMAQLTSNKAHDPAATSRLVFMRFASNEAVTAPLPPAWPHTLPPCHSLSRIQLEAHYPDVALLAQPRMRLTCVTIFDIINRNLMYKVTLI